LLELKQEGKIRYLGISNVTLKQIEEARNIVEIASVQNRFSITERSNQDILDYYTQNNIAFIPYGSLDAPNIILIPGTTTIAHLEEKIAVNSIHLTTDEINLLNQIDKI
jgi:pyridoxine 4-dehydrogenase